MRRAAFTVSKTWITLGGISGVDVLVYGPKCAARLGLIPEQPCTTKTQLRPVKRATKRLFKNQLVSVRDGQIEMF